ITGYVDPSIPPSSKKTDRHIGCFDGFIGSRFGGPENSLTLWGDQGDPEILCDYGAAYTFMQYLYDHYGLDFMTALHRNDRTGFNGLRRVLSNQTGGKTKAQTVIHRWAVMVALDRALDRNGHNLIGGKAGRFTSKSLRSEIKFVNPEAYNGAGAPLN